jgi:hypothetical protein
VGKVETGIVLANVESPAQAGVHKDNDTNMLISQPAPSITHSGEMSQVRKASFDFRFAPEKTDSLGGPPAKLPLDVCQPTKAAAYNMNIPGTLKRPDYLVSSTEDKQINMCGSKNSMRLRAVCVTSMTSCG